MIHPTAADIGRAVLYRASHLVIPGAERGIIIGFNEAVVFVRYSGDIHAKATRRDDLEWEFQA